MWSNALDLVVETSPIDLPQLDDEVTGLLARDDDQANCLFWSNARGTLLVANIRLVTYLFANTHLGTYPCGSIHCEICLRFLLDAELIRSLIACANNHSATCLEVTVGLETDLAGSEMIRLSIHPAEMGKDVGWSDEIGQSSLPDRLCCGDDQEVVDASPPWDHGAICWNGVDWASRDHLLESVPLAWKVVHVYHH